MLFQNSLGIDIRENRVTLVGLKASLKGIKLFSHGTHVLDGSQPIETRLKQVGGFAEAFMSEHALEGADVFVGISRDMAVQRTISLPVAVKENLSAALKYEMEKYIPLAAGDFYFDYQIISEDKINNTLNVLLLVIKKDDLKPYIDFFRDGGAGICGIEISATALTNYWHHGSHLAEKGVYIYLFPDGEHYELGVLKNGKLQYFKTITGCCDQNDIAESLVREVRYLRDNSGPLPGGVKIGSPVGGLTQEMIERMGGETNIPVSLSPLSCDELPDMGLAPAFGLALKGLKNLPMQLNLLPREIRKKPSKLGYYTMVLLLGMVLMASISWGASHVLKQRMFLDKLNTRFNALKADVAHVKEVQGDIEEIEGQISQIETIRRGYLPVSDILKELTELAPDNVWLQELVLSGASAQISGLANSASELITILEASPIFHDVVFLSAITKDRDGNERFRIGFKFN